MAPLSEVFQLMPSIHYLPWIEHFNCKSIELSDVDEVPFLCEKLFGGFVSPILITKEYLEEFPITNKSCKRSFERVDFLYFRCICHQAV